MFKQLAALFVALLLLTTVADAKLAPLSGHSLYFDPVAQIKPLLTTPNVRAASNYVSAAVSGVLRPVADTLVDYAQVSAPAGYILLCPTDSMTPLTQAPVTAQNQVTITDEGSGFYTVSANVASDAIGRVYYTLSELVPDAYYTVKTEIVSLNGTVSLDWNDTITWSPPLGVSYMGVACATYSSVYRFLDVSGTDFKVKIKISTTRAAALAEYSTGNITIGKSAALFSVVPQYFSVVPSTAATSQQIIWQNDPLRAARDGVDTYAWVTSNYINLRTRSTANIVNSGISAATGGAPLYNKFVSPKGLWFDSAANAIDLGTDNFVATGDVTIYAVIKPQGWGAGQAGRVLDNGTCRLFTMGYVPGVSGVTTNVIAFSRRAGDDGYVLTPSGSIVLGQQYIVCVTSSAAGLNNIYLNNVLSSTASRYGPLAATTSLYVGNLAAANRGFDGLIKEIIIYPRLDNAQQRRHMYSTLLQKHGRS